MKGLSNEWTGTEPVQTILLAVLRDAQMRGSVSCFHCRLFLEAWHDETMHHYVKLRVLRTFPTRLFLAREQKMRRIDRDYYAPGLRREQDTRQDAREKEQSGMS